MNDNSFNFVTDTSTLCIFDLACLKHRLDNDVDWWSLPEDELSEINLGNVAFLGLGKDGEFLVEVVDFIADPMIKTNLRVCLGNVFVGAGEEVTADELEPECVRGGGFITMEAGNYVLSAKIEGSKIQISFAVSSEGENNFERLLRLVD